MTTSEFDIDARITVEAMRLGVVPRHTTREYTVGREKLLQEIRADLDLAERGGALRALIGEYGAGKTHMLTCVQDEALEHGFVTTRVTLNPHDTSPANPQRVYRALMRSLTLPDREGGPHGLSALIDRALDSPTALERFHVGSIRAATRTSDYLTHGRHLYLTPALQQLQALQDAAEDAAGDDVSAEERARVASARGAVLAWLSGDHDLPTGDLNTLVQQSALGRGKLFSLKDYRPWARIYGYLLSGLASLAQAVGYKGLVVLIDEAEFYALLDAAHRDFARTLFKALAYASLGPRPAEGLTLPFDPDQELIDGGAGVLRQVPGKWAADAPLYTLFVMTPDRAGLQALDGAIPPSCRSELGLLTPAQFEELASRVRAIYGRAYPSQGTNATVERLIAKLGALLMQAGVLTTPRAGMKFLVELMDISRHRSNKDFVRAIETLRGHLGIGSAG